MLVTLDIKGPPRAVLLTPYPDNAAVRQFRDHFRHALSNKTILVSEIETRSWAELCTAFISLPKNYNYNCLLILSHGTQNHRIVLQDPDFPLPDRLQDIEFLGDLRGWSGMFRSAFDDKLLMFAACHSGHLLNVDPLLHTGMALHVIAPTPNNPELEVSSGAKAMARYLEILDQKNKDVMTPDDLAEAEGRVNADFPDTLKLWPYEADPSFVADLLKDLQ